MKLTQMLGNAVSEDARRQRQSHPKGFEPGVKFSIDSGQPESAVISSNEEIFNAEDHRKKIEDQTKLSIPESLDVRLDRLTLQNDSAGNPVRWWYKYVFVDRSVSGTAAEPIDAAAILKSIREGRKASKPKYASETATMGLIWADWQMGKKEGGGTPAILERLDSAFTAAEHRAKELNKLGRGLGELVIFGNGDLVEGCEIFPNQQWQIDCDTRDQMNYGITAALEGLDRLAPLFERVRVVAVGGNHGEKRQNGFKVNNHDNRDVEMFEHVARTAARDSKLAHVNFMLAQNELVKTTDIHGWIFANTHGQVFGKGVSGGIERKAYSWYSGQAAGHLPAGDANVLITSHFHHEAAADWGACLWKQSGHMDGGSGHFTDVAGSWSNHGMLSFVVTPESRWQDQQILV